MASHGRICTWPLYVNRIARDFDGHFVICGLLVRFVKRVFLRTCDWWSIFQMPLSFMCIGSMWTSTRFIHYALIIITCENRHYLRHVERLLLGLYLKTNLLEIWIRRMWLPTRYLNIWTIAQFPMVIVDHFFICSCEYQFQLQLGKI